MPSIRVHKIPVMSDYWGRKFKRPLRSDVLQKSIEEYFAKSDNALLFSLGELHQRRYRLGDLRAVTASLFQEGEYAYVFKVGASVSAGGRSRLAMIVAKNEGKMSRAASVEHENLKKIYRRGRDIVVMPLGGGMLELTGPQPGRVYVYFTKWLDRHHELGVQHQNMNFYINELPFQYFDARTSEEIKSRMLAIMLRLYDPVNREAIEPPKVGAGDFVVTRSRPHELRLIACRKILKGVALERCLRLYLGYQGSWGERLFTFVPKDARMLKKALVEGLVVQNGLSEKALFFALKRYRDSLIQVKKRHGLWTPLESIEGLLSEARPLHG